MKKPGAVRLLWYMAIPLPIPRDRTAKVVPSPRNGHSFRQGDGGARRLPAGATPAPCCQGAVLHDKGVGRRSFVYLAVGALLLSAVLAWERGGKARGGLAAPPSPRTASGPGWLLAGRDLAAVVPAPQHGQAQRGTQALLAGRMADALSAFRSLALDLPENAAVQSNLAALYLARAERLYGSAYDLVLALESAERAVHLAPHFAPALFNLAEARTRLHLPVAATETWNRFLQHGTSARAERAQHAMAALHQPSAWEDWQAERARFEAAALAGNEAELRDLVSRFPLFARLHAEEILLPAWARALLAGDREDAERLLAALDSIGRVFAERTHDAMVVDTIGLVERAGAARRLQIARGIAAFGEGMARYRQVVTENPAEPLRRAAETLDGCPLGLWARLYGCVPLLYSDSIAAETVLRRLEEATDASRYPVLAGRVRWLRGTAAINRDRPEQAIAHYKIAFARLAGSEGPQSAEFLHLLLAEAFGKAGEREEEWAQRLAALLSGGRTGELRAVFSTLYDTIESLLAAGRPWAAQAFARELQGVAHQWGIPTARAEAALQRGRVLEVLGDRARASREFRRARASLQAVGFEDFRERIGMTLEMAEGQALAASDPAAAIPWLTSALARQRRHAYLYQQAALLSVRARAFHAVGRLEEEAADLEQAIEIFETRRADITDPGLRQSAFEAAQSAFDQMVSLQAEGLGDAERALAYAERSRGRLLLDQLLDGKAREAFSLADLGQALPAGTALVEYALLPDRLYIWTLADRRLQLHVEPVAAAELERLVEQLEIGIGDGSVSRQEPGPAAALYDHLFRPIARDLSPDARLVLVPDRCLARVPFASLFDAARARFVVEEWAITVQPSASLFNEIARRTPGRATVGLLVVGDPAFDRSLYRSLARLPAAADEASQIADLYGGATLLADTSATRGAFVRGAPDAAVIHVAGHALPDPREPQRSFLVLRPDRPGDTGALSAVDVAGLDLSGTRLIVLSVCRGVAGGDVGRESVSGLAAGFLAAGAGSVVASLWNVSDEATRDLMVELHRRYRATGSPAQSLRAVQRAALQRGDPPAEWAGFTVYGRN